MRRHRLAAILLAAGALFAAPGAALADTSQVVIFSTEIQPLSTYAEPDGCYSLPPGAHVLTNQTDRPVKTYADPFCMTPNLAVQPGHGSHVATGTGSFSA